MENNPGRNVPSCRISNDCKFVCLNILKFPETQMKYLGNAEIGMFRAANSMRIDRPAVLLQQH